MLVGRVEARIREHFPALREVTLHTIGQHATFGVVVRDDALVLILGSVEPRTPKRLEWPWLDSTAEFLAAGAWVVVGGKHESAGEPGTLDGFLKRFRRTHVANYVAAVLEEAGVVEVDEGPPVLVRLRK